MGGPSVPLETVSLTGTITDPMSTARLQVLEQPPSLSILPQQQYITIDEGGVSNPTHNFICNGYLAHPTSNQWSINNPAGTSLSDLSPGFQVQVTNIANGAFPYELQNVQLGYIVPGQTYCISIYECITATISGGNAVFKFDFLDASATILSGGTSDSRTTTSGASMRIALTGTAPAGAASIQVVMGILANNATNSGTVQFRECQVECQWFVNEGIRYPTPFTGGSAITATDTMVRANAGSWGTASNGQAWTTTGHASTQSITSNEGIISATAGADTFNQLGADVTSDQVVTCRISVNQTTDVAGVQGRWTPGSGGTCYKFLYGGFSNILLNKSVAGANTTLASTAFTMTPGTFYWFKLLCSGSSVFGKIWADGTTEPVAYNLSATDTSVTAGGFSVLANSNSGTGISFDHFSASDPGSGTCYTLPDSTTIRQTRLFAGYVQTAQAQYEGTLRTWSLVVASNSILIDTFYLANVNYSNLVDGAGIIVSSVNANYSATSQLVASGNGVYTYLTTNNVVNGATIDYLTIADMTFKDVLATLANSSGYYYYVDPYFDLHYAPPGYEQAAFGLCGNGTQPNAAPTDGTLPTYTFYAYKYTNDGSQIKNRIKVFGGKFIAPAITDTFVGNGATKNFLMSQIPFNITQVKRDGADITSTTGVVGINTNGVGGIVALYDKATPTLKYNTAPAASGSITYTYAQDVIIRTRDMGSIAKYNRIFDSKINDTSLNSLLAADQRGLAELVQFSQPRGLVTLTTQQPLYAGQSFQMTSTYDGLTKAPYVVQRSTQTYLGNGIYEYAIEAGAYNPDLVAILVNIHKALLRNPVTAGQVIQEEHYVIIDPLVAQDLETHTP